MIVAVQTLVYFRESIFGAINKAFGYLSLSLRRDSDDGEDEEYEEVFSDYNEEKGVAFFPPVYLQRYAAVLECLMDKRWRGKIEKVVDFGYNDAGFINHLKGLPGIKTILGVDLNALPLKCAYNHLDTNISELMKVGLYQGNAADPDYRLIGCDAVVAIEMVEHMLPHDLDRLVHNIFGFIKPQLAVITTPNGDFNVLFKALESNGLRRLDHYFEWTRTQFHEWCSNIVTRYPLYTVTCKGIGPGPEGTEHLGCCSQLALFVSNDYRKQLDLDINSLVQVSEVQNSDENSSSEWKDNGTDLETLNCSISHVKKYLKDTMDLITSNNDSPLLYMKDVVSCVNNVTKKSDLNTKNDGPVWNNINWGNNTPYWNQYYKVVKELKYPFDEKPDEFNILSIIFEEVDRIVQENKDSSEQIVISMSRVMDLVKDITDDEAYVREYLEWNNCELTEDLLLFPRPFVENSEDDANDIPNIRSVEKLNVSKTKACRYISHSDETEIDNAIQNKVNRLKYMMNGDDFANKLGNVIYRLTSMGLVHARRYGLPNEVWFKWKLLNMLCCTERSVDRSRRFFVETYQLGSNDDKIEDCTDESFTSSLPDEPSTPIKQRSILTDSQSCHSLLEGECDSLGSGDPELLSQDYSESHLKGAKCTLKEFHAIHFDKMEIKKSTVDEFRPDAAFKGDVSENFGTEISEMDYDTVKYDSGSELVDDSTITNCDYQEGLGVTKPPLDIDAESVVTFAKPIPTGIIELCKIRENNYNPDLVLECNDKKSRDSIMVDNGEVKEETQEDSFSCPIITEMNTATIDKSSKFCMENPSENIFLYDENEPSTSKGIRRHNIRLDAQCGSDTEINASVLNILPQHNSTGSQIHSSLTNLDTEAISEMQSNIKINYFEKPIVIKESSGSINVTIDSRIENESIVSASISKRKPEDVDVMAPMDIIENTEENLSLERVTKNTELGVISKVNDNYQAQNEDNLKQIADDGKSEEESDPKPLTKLDINIMNVSVKPNLCRGAIQMHNFSEKQSFEDIIYQGNWLLSTVKESPKSKSILINSTKKFQPKKLSKENLDLRNVIEKVNSKRKCMNDKTVINNSPIGSPKKIKHTAFNYLQKSIDVHELTTVTKITAPPPIKHVKTANPQKLPPKLTVRRTSKTKINQNPDKKLGVNRKRSQNTSKKHIKDEKENVDQENISSDNGNPKSEHSEHSQEKVCRSSSDSSCSSSPNSLATVLHNTQSKSSLKNFSILSFENQSLINESQEKASPQVEQILNTSDNMKESFAEMHKGPVNVSQTFTKENIYLFENNSMCNLQIDNSEEIEQSHKPKESVNLEQIKYNLKANEYEEISLASQITNEEVGITYTVDEETDELKLNFTENPKEYNLEQIDFEEISSISPIPDEEVGRTYGVDEDTDKLRSGEKQTLVKSSDRIHGDEAKILLKQDEVLINSSSKILGEFSRATSSPTPSDGQALTPRSVDFSIKESAQSESSEYMTVVDFETGSVDVIRKTTPDFDDSTSSVASYFSCNIDDTLSASHGLFQDTNHHNQEDVSSSFSTIVNAGLDENLELSLDTIDNSVMEAGAGDGRGVHSDSQNSTGIDTSLNSSTSDVSSGPITDAVTVHESSLSDDYDLLEENRSMVLQDFVAGDQFGDDPPENWITEDEQLVPDTDDQ